MPVLIVHPTEDELNTAINNVLTGLVPDTVEIILGQANRVPEPVKDFLCFWPVGRPRLTTNVDDYEDAVFTGSIAGTTLTIATVESGEIDVGSPVFGDGVASGTTVTERGTGTGGVGTYVVNNSQTVAQTTIAAGTKTIVESVSVRYQFDAHGDSSANVIQIVSAVFRDAYGVEIFQAENTAITPLHADEPQQLAFTDGEQQYENRWGVDAHLQVNFTVSLVPQQFFTTAEVGIISVDAEYPPV